MTGTAPGGEGGVREWGVRHPQGVRREGSEQAARQLAASWNASGNWAGRCGVVSRTVTPWTEETPDA